MVQEFFCWLISPEKLDSYHYDSFRRVPDGGGAGATWIANNRDTGEDESIAKLYSSAEMPEEDARVACSLVGGEWDDWNDLTRVHDAYKALKPKGSKLFTVPEGWETVKIAGVEVFTDGTWNGYTYSERDIISIVRDTASLIELVKPYIKLGHDVRQPLTDGMPALGWAEAVRLNDRGFVEIDFVEVAKLIGDLVAVRAYKRVSVELWKNPRILGTKYDWFLEAVSFLGAALPAVTTLEDIPAYYKNTLESFAAIERGDDTEKLVVNFSLESPESSTPSEDGSSATRRTVTFSKEELTMKRKFTIAGVVIEVDEADKESIAKFEAIETADQKQAEALSAATTDAADAKKTLAERETAETTAIVDVIVKKYTSAETPKVAPKHADTLRAILTALSTEKATFTVGEGDNSKDEEASLLTALEEILEGAGDLADFEDKAKTGGDHTSLSSDEREMEAGREAVRRLKKAGALPGVPTLDEEHEDR